MVGAVVVYPVASGILLSFRQMQINRPRLGEPWVGLDQYRRLWEDEVFRTAAGNTVYWVVGGAAKPVPARTDRGPGPEPQPARVSGWPES